MQAPSQPNQTAGCCLAGIVIAVVGIAVFCSGAFGNASQTTPEQDQLEYDRNLQAQQQWDHEEAARKDLLDKGYSPEDTEAAIKVERAVREGQAKP